MSSVFTDTEHTLYIEAVRCIPGMLVCMENSQMQDGRDLLTGFFKRAQTMHVPRETAWSILFTATMHWTGNLLDQVAESASLSVVDAARQMGMMSALWESEGCPHRG